ncbi:MAG TPA: hypothetical protein VK892_15900 [Pyrinomonadaceae bacterium]|nr:hypothetical protein [Pyrinomonadaceae bacterium]
MRQGEVKVLEKDIIVFSVEVEQNATEVSEKEIVTVESKVVKIDIKKRFARLKKSLRKRSASIL